MRRLVLYGLAITVVGIGALALAALPARDDQPDYRFSLLERGDIVREIVASGTLEAVVKVEVSSQLSGQIAELLVDFNDNVRTGQALAKLDAKTFEARLQEEQAKLENAKASYTSAVASTAGARAQYDEAKRNLSRKEDLQAKKILSHKELDVARRNELTALSELRAKEAEELVKETGINIAKASLLQAEIDLQRTVIRAPIDGIVVRRSIDLGQTVAASLKAPTLFTITQDLRRMQVETFVGEADIGQILLGQRAEFQVDAYPGRKFTGEVLEVRKSPQMVQNVVTYTVIISAENPDNVLLPGMTADVSIIVAELRSVLKVPNAALRFSPESETSGEDTETAIPNTGLIWVRKGPGRQLSQITVKRGYSDNSYTEVIAEGIEDGEEVAVGHALRKTATGWWLKLGF